MKQAYVPPPDDRRATLDTEGGKSASLARILRAGVPVPPADGLGSSVPLPESQRAFGGRCRNRASVGAVSGLSARCL